MGVDQDWDSGWSMLNRCKASENSRPGSNHHRHVRIEVTDIHYIGKEADELDEQVFLGFDPDAQHEYGMESEAYAKLSSEWWSVWSIMV